MNTLNSYSYAPIQNKKRRLPTAFSLARKKQTASHLKPLSAVFFRSISTRKLVSILYHIFGWLNRGRTHANALLTHACVSNALSVLALKFQRFYALVGVCCSLRFPIIKGSNPSLSANQTAVTSGFSFSLSGNVGATFSLSASAIPLDEEDAPPKTCVYTPRVVVIFE